MDEILADTSKFKLLDDNAVKLTLKPENQVKVLLKKRKSDNCINAKLITNCIPLHVTRIGILYGLPKIHKPSVTFRRIANCMYFEGFDRSQFIKLFFPFCAELSPYL